MVHHITVPSKRCQYSISRAIYKLLVLHLRRGEGGVDGNAIRGMVCRPLWDAVRGTVWPAWGITWPRLVVQVDPFFMPGRVVSSPPASAYIPAPNRASGAG